MGFMESNDVKSHSCIAIMKEISRDEECVYKFTLCNFPPM